MKTKAIDLFLRQRRFDLIFKYLYIAKPSEFAKKAYLENIRAFNNFHEDCPSDGIPKTSSVDFISGYEALIKRIKEDGFNKDFGSIPIGLNGEIWDGAHRLSACAFLNIDIDVVHTNISNSYWDYGYFQTKGMRSDIMDYGALEYVKLNPNAYIVNLQPVTKANYDKSVVDILEKYGFIYYQKDCWISFNGLVNLKKICYGSSWEKAAWIGSYNSGFRGAKDHADSSMGKNPMRVFVFVCNDLNNVKKAKEEIRALYGIGNYSVHINDTHAEAICLAENYFNENTLFQLNTRPYKYYDSVFESNIDYLKAECLKNDVDTDNICGAGSTPLNVFQIRHSQDLDYLTIDKGCLPENEIISSHNKHQNLYPYPIQDIVTDPAYHMYYNGIKFISLEILYAMKKRSPRELKNILDYRKANTILTYRKLLNIIRQSRICRGGRTRKQSQIVLLLYKYNKCVRRSIKYDIQTKRHKLREKEQYLSAKIFRNMKVKKCQ
jgi:hypothetical protein